ncbi:MAG TPA: glycosyltransferase [Caldilineaceae bacterium]|nr:glycosyltransferase [Caldilineaceae bacterium]
MHNTRILFVGGSNLLYGLNHRSRHLLAYLQQQVGQVDAVAYTNFSSGQQSVLLHNLWHGLRHLPWGSIQVTEQNHHRQIIVRKLFLPHPLNLLAQDLWCYQRLQSVLRPPYALGIVGHAENALLARMLKRRGLVEQLIYDDWDYYPGLEPNRLGAWMMAQREQSLMHTADLVMTINPRLAALRRQQGAQQVVVVPNGVDLMAFAEARKRHPHPPTLVYIGSLASHWGVDLAIRALPLLLPQLPTLRLLIAGSGPDQQRLQELSRRLGVAAHVHFYGAVSYEVLPELLAQADIGVATSRADSTFRQYASPLKLIEYMAAGLPIIATRVGQQTQTMVASEAGLLIDQSPRDFAVATLALLTNPAFAQRCRAAAVAYVAAYDWTTIWERVFPLLSADHDNGSGAVQPHGSTSAMPNTAG